MAITVFTILVALVIKKIIQTVYDDCKVGFWITCVLVAVLVALIISAIFEKISLIPVLLFW
jgi:hypothetical protein